MVSTLWKKGRRGSAPSVSGGGAQRGLGEEEIAGGLRGGRGLKDGPLVVLQRREPISDIGRMIFALGGFHAQRRTKIGRADLGNHFLLGPDRNLIVIFVQRLAIEPRPVAGAVRSEEHTSELQSLMRISYAVFCLKQKNLTHSDNSM